MDPKRPRTRILLVEGDPVQKMLLREYLEHGTEFKVTEPKGAFHLLSLCEYDRLCPDLILLDMEWPRVDGIALALEIWKRNPDLPILGMTERQAKLYDDKRLRGYSIGLIRKPFSPHQLHRSIAATMRAKALRDLDKKREALIRARSGFQAMRTPSKGLRP